MDENNNQRNELKTEPVRVSVGRRENPVNFHDKRGFEYERCTGREGEGFVC